MSKELMRLKKAHRYDSSHKREYWKAMLSKISEYWDQSSYKLWLF